MSGFDPSGGTPGMESKIEMDTADLLSHKRSLQATRRRGGDCHSCKNPVTKDESYCSRSSYGCFPKYTGSKRQSFVQEERRQLINIRDLDHQMLSRAL